MNNQLMALQFISLSLKRILPTKQVGIWFFGFLPFFFFPMKFGLTVVFFKPAFYTTNAWYFSTLKIKLFPE